MMNEEQRKKLYGILNNLHENSEHGAKKYWSDEEAVHHHFSRVKRWTTGASVATSSLVGVSLLIPRVREHKHVPVIGGILSILNAALIAYCLTTDFTREERRRRDIACRHDALRARIHYYATVHLPDATNFKQESTRVQRFMAEQIKINRSSPPLFDTMSYDKARDGGIAQGESPQFEHKTWKIQKEVGADD